MLRKTSKDNIIYDVFKEGRFLSVDDNETNSPLSNYTDQELLINLASRVHNKDFFLLTNEGDDNHSIALKTPSVAFYFDGDGKIVDVF